MSTNPFFQQPAPPTPEPETEPDVLLGRRLAVLGPPVPPGTAKAPLERCLARSNVTHDPLLWVVGVHGGAGASSVASLLADDVRESPRSWPVNPYLEPQVLLVARTHAHGLSILENALQEWAANEVPDLSLLGVVLVDDAPKIPRPLVGVMNRVLHAAPRGWHLPWQESWRTRLVEDRPLSLFARRTFADIARRAAEGRAGKSHKSQSE